MTPLVNGVKSYSIYSQRLSPITVVEKNLTVCILYVSLLLRRLYPPQVLLVSFFISLINKNSLELLYGYPIHSLQLQYPLHCGWRDKFSVKLEKWRVCDNFHGHCVCNNFLTVVNRNPKDSGICASIGSEPRRNSLQPYLNSNVLSFFFLLCVCMFVFGR